jgi:hypothetical protein
VGWERASSFGFSALGFSVGENQMCLTERWDFQLAENKSVNATSCVYFCIVKHNSCVSSPTKIRFLVFAE